MSMRSISSFVRAVWIHFIDINLNKGPVISFLFFLLLLLLFLLFFIGLLRCFLLSSLLTKSILVDWESCAWVRLNDSLPSFFLFGRLDLFTDSWDWIYWFFCITISLFLFFLFFFLLFFFLFCFIILSKLLTRLFTLFLALFLLLFLTIIILSKFLTRFFALFLALFLAFFLFFLIFDGPFR